MDVPEEEYQIEVLPEDTNEKIDITFKIIVLGDSGVGKSCFTIRGTKNLYQTNEKVTVGFSFQSIVLKVNDKILKLQIWDTCGQEQYKSMVQNFFRNSSLAIVMYAIDNKSSFDDVRLWLNEVKSKSNPNVKIFLIGNKSDLADRRVISTQQGLQLKQDEGFQLFMESSALSGDNVQQIFIEAAKILMSEYSSFRTSIDYSNNRLSLASNSFNALSGGNNIAVPKPPEMDKIKNKHHSQGCC